MADNIDERVVRMKFDNSDFKRGVDETIKDKKRLDSELKKDNSKDAFASLAEAINKVTFEPILKGMDAVQVKMSMGQIMFQRITERMTDAVINFGKNIVKNLTLTPVISGMNEYNLKLQSVQTIMSSTGESVQVVSKYLDELNEYADKTIYSFSDMTRNIGTFTNAGVSLKDSVAAIKGVSSAAALAGVDTNKASHAMYNFAQALSTGYVGLLDWKSIEVANMATDEFKQTLIDTAVSMGTLKVNADGTYKTLSKGLKLTSTAGFRDSLKDQWLTTDVLIKTLKDYSDETTNVGARAMAAAQDIKTFSQLIDVLNESVQSGWAQTWEILLGDLEEAKKLWTGVNNVVGPFIDNMSKVRNEALQTWKNLGGLQQVIDYLKLGFYKLSVVFKQIKNAWHDVMPETSLLDKLGSFTNFIKNLVSALKLNKEMLSNLRDTFGGLFAVVSIVTDAIAAFYRGIIALGVGLTQIFGEDLLKGTGALGRFLKTIKQINDQFGIIRVTIALVVTAILMVAKAVRNLISTVLGIIPVEKIITTAFTVIAEVIGYLSVPTYYAIKAIKALINFIRQLGDITLESIINSFKYAWEHLPEIIDAVSASMKRLWNYLTDNFPFLEKLKVIFQNVVSWVSNFAQNFAQVIGKAFNFLREHLSSLMKALRDFFVENIDMTELIGIAFSTTILLFGIGIMKVFNSISTTISSVADVVKSVSGFMNGLTDALKGFSLNLKANAILKIALAIGFLASSVAALSFLDPGAIMAAAGAILMIGVALAAVIAAMGVAKKFMDFDGKGLIGLAAVLAAFAASLLAFKDLKMGDALEALFCISVLGLIYAGISVLVSKYGGEAKTSIAFFVGMAVLMSTMAASIKKFMSIDLGQNPTKKMHLLLDFIKMMGMLILATKLQISTKNGSIFGSLEGTFLGFIGLAFALQTFIKVINNITDMDENLIQEKIGLIGGILTSFAGILIVSKLAGQHISKFGSMLRKMALAIGIIFVILKLFKGTTMEDVKGPFEIMTELIKLFAGLIVASLAAGENADKAGSMLLKLGPTLLIISAAIALLSKMDPKSLIAPMIALSLVMGIIIGIILSTAGLGENADKAAAVVSSLKSAIIVLSACMVLLSLIRVERVLVSATALVAVMGMIALIIYNTAKINKNVEKAKTVVGMITAILISLTIALAIMAGFEDPLSVLVVAGGLSLVIAAVGDIFKKLSGFRNMSKDAFKAAGIVAAMVTLISGIIVIMSEMISGKNLDSAIAGAASVSVLLLAIMPLFKALSSFTTNNKFDWKGAAAALGELTIVVGLIGTGVTALTHLAGDNLVGAATICGIVGALLYEIAKLAPAISEIEDVSGADLAKALIGLLSAFGILATVVSFIASKIEIQNVQSTIIVLGACAGLLAEITYLASGLGEIEEINGSTIGALAGLAAVASALILVVGLFTMFAEDVDPWTIVSTMAGVSALMLAIGGTMKIIDGIEGVDMSVIGKFAVLSAVAAAIAALFSLVSMIPGDANTAVKLMLGVSPLMLAMAGVFAIISIVSATGSNLLAVAAFAILSACAAGITALFSLIAMIPGSDKAIDLMKGAAEVMFEMSIVMGIVEIVGAAASFAIPGILVVVGGMVAIGALFALIGAIFGEAEGLKELIAAGAEVFKFIGTTIVEVIGAVVDAIIDVISRNLDTLGQGLGALVGGVIEPIKQLAETDASGFDNLGKLATALLAFGGAELANSFSNILNFFGGGRDLAAKMNDALPAIKTFVDDMSQFKEEELNKAKTAAELLGILMEAIPNEGGLFDLFSGNKNFADVATGLTFLSTGIGNLARTIANVEIDQSSVDKAKNMGDIIKVLYDASPNIGGLWGAISGDPSLTISAIDLKNFVSRIDTIADSLRDCKVDETCVKKAKMMGEVLDAIYSNAPDEGFSFAALFGGSHDIEDTAGELKNFVDKMKEVFESMNTISVTDLMHAELFGKVVKALLACGGAALGEDGEVSPVIAMFGSYLGGATANTLTNLASAIKGMADALKDTDFDILSKTKDASSNVVDIINRLSNSRYADIDIDQLDDVLDIVISMLEDISDIEINTDSMNNLKTTIASLISFANAIAAVDPDAISSFAEILQTLKDLGSDGITALTDGFSNTEGLTEVITKCIEDIFITIDTLITAKLSHMYDMGQELLEYLVNGFGGTSTGKVDFKTPVNKIIDQINATITANEQDLIDIGNLVSEGLIEGMLGKQRAVSDAASSVARTIIDSTRTALDMHSPPPEQIDVGEQSDQGLIDGMDNKQDDVGDKAAEVAREIPEGAQEETEKPDYKEKLQNAAVNAVDPFLVKLDDMGILAYDKGAGIVNQAIAGITNAVSNFIDDKGGSTANNILDIIGKVTGGGDPKDTFMQMLGLVGGNDRSDFGGNAPTNKKTVAEEMEEKMKDKMGNLGGTGGGGGGGGGGKKTAEEAKSEVEQRAEELVKEFKEKIDALNEEIDTAQLEFDLWGKLNPNASETEKNQKQVEFLLQKIERQTEIVKLQNEQYTELSKLGEEAASQTHEAYKTLLKEKGELADLITEINNMNTNNNEVDKGKLQEQIYILQERMGKEQVAISQYIDTLRKDYVAQGMTYELAQKTAEQKSKALWDTYNNMAKTKEDYERQLRGVKVVASEHKQVNDAIALIGMDITKKSNEAAKGAGSSSGNVYATSYANSIDTNSYKVTDSTTAMTMSSTDIAGGEMWTNAGSNAMDNMASGIKSNSGAVSGAVQEVISESMMSALTDMLKANGGKMTSGMINMIADSATAAAGGGLKAVHGGIEVPMRGWNGVPTLGQMFETSNVVNQLRRLVGTGELTTKQFERLEATAKDASEPLKDVLKQMKVMNISVVNNEKQLDRFVKYGLNSIHNNVFTQEKLNSIKQELANTPMDWVQSGSRYYQPKFFNGDKVAEAAYAQTAMYNELVRQGKLDRERANVMNSFVLKNASTSRDMLRTVSTIQSAVSANLPGMAGKLTSAINNAGIRAANSMNTTINFSQTNNSPKAMSASKVSRYTMNSVAKAVATALTPGAKLASKVKDKSSGGGGGGTGSTKGR